jgi:perosamine synthetase
MKVPVNRPLLIGNESKYVREAISSGWISSDGPFVSEFENKFASEMGRKYGVAVSNGTIALELAVKVLEIGPGDEVIIPTFTIISCAAAVILNGAKPIFVDCYSDTWNMDVEKIEEYVSENTKAIMVVHIFGLPTEMQKVIEIAKKYNLRVIEDAAEAHGQRYFDKPCGSFGDISTFSFYANKHITSGEGGMVLTDDFQIAQRLRYLRNLCFDEKKRFFHKELSSNYRITNLQAAVGLAQLENLKNTILRKRKLGLKYKSLLSNNPKLQLPIDNREGYVNHYWVYGVVIRDVDISRMENIKQRLSEMGVGFRPFFWPLHKQPALNKLGLLTGEKLINSEFISKFGIYLPSGVGTTEREIEYSAITLLEILDES